MLILAFLLSGCAWKLGPPEVAYAQSTATLPLVHTSVDRKRWYVVLDAGEHGEWVWFVDTGYSWTTCDDDFVEALGLATRSAGSTRGELGRLKTGKAQLPDVFVGDHRLSGLVCQTRDLHTTSSISDPSEVRVAGVLGIDTLRPFRVQLDPRAAEVRLDDPSVVEALGVDGAVVPIRRIGGVDTRVRLPIGVEGVQTRPLLDTGASNTYLDGARLGLEPTWVQENVRIRGSGPGGSATEDRAYFEVDGVDVAGHRVGPITLTDRKRGPGAPGLLGLDILDRFLIELDFTRGVARFTPVDPAVRPAWTEESPAAVRIR